MPRFVLLRHECPAEFEKPSHWDLMLEWNGLLRTWELRELPTAWAIPSDSDNNSKQVVATALPDHRLDYLNYEGPISGDRGSVQRIDKGTYELLATSDDLLHLILRGNFIHGQIQLTQGNSGWTIGPIDETK